MPIRVRSANPSEDKAISFLHLSYLTIESVGAGKMSFTIVKEDVIYCRFSSELQRDESNADQERRCRDGLDRLAIPHEHIRVIRDAAVSGTSEKRSGFAEILDLMNTGRLGILVVSEQSRFSRGDKVKALIRDIVYNGGRFISVSEA